MASWPVGLPDQQFLPLTYSRQDARLRTPNDAGQANQRKRFTAAPVRVTLGIVLTGAELTIFKSFWQTDLAEGSLPFDWIDPTIEPDTDGSEIVSYRFVEAPSFSAEVGDVTAAARLWQSNLSLEILP